MENSGKEEKILGSVGTPEQERMDAITEAILRILKRQERLESRLAGIEQRLGLEPSPQQAPFQSPHEASIQSSYQAPPQPAPVPPQSEAIASSESAPINTAALDQDPIPPSRTDRQLRHPRFETRMGLTLVNRVGAITLVLGIAFFFKYAVDNQWIGETGRVVLGILAGLAALAIGHRLWERGQPVFAQGITGAGIAILYIAFYAAFVFYRIMPQPLSFILMTLNTAAAAALAFRYEAQAIALLGLFGGYLTPVLLSTGEDRPWLLFSYILLLDAGAIAIEHSKRWRGPVVLAFLGTYGLYFAWIVNEFGPETRTVAFVFSLAYFALFVARRSPRIAALSHLLTGFALLVISIPQLAPFLPAMTAVILAAMWVDDKRSRPETPVAALAAFWVPYFLGHHEWKSHGSPETIALFLTLQFLLFLGWLPWRMLVRGGNARSSDLVLVISNALLYFGAVHDLLDTRYHAYLGLFAIALGAIHYAVARRLWGSRHPDSVRPALLYAGLALLFLTLAIPIQLSGYRITMAWAVEGAALTWIAVRMRNRYLSDAAIVVMALVLIRLATLDSGIYSRSAIHAVLLNPRFLTFLIAACSLWAAAWWSRERWRALSTYLAGHVVLLWTLVLEVLDWARRTAPQADSLSVQSTSVSILFALYAVVLVAIGVARRSALNRALGLALIGFVVAKLYLYDVWQIGRIYRVGAFAALGMLLLLTSYLYSRFRGLIEDWWKDEKAAG